jgi:hypothetical protein
MTVTFSTDSHTEVDLDPELEADAHAELQDLFDASVSEVRTDCDSEGGSSHSGAEGREVTTNSNDKRLINLLKEILLNP